MAEINYDRMRELVARGQLAPVVRQLAAASPPAYRRTILRLSAHYQDLERALSAETQQPALISRTRNRLFCATLDLLDAMENGETLAPHSEAAQIILADSLTEIGRN